MARRRVIRMSQDELNASALVQAHPFQKLALGEMLAKRYNVASIQRHPKTNDRLMFMRSVEDPKLGCAVYPNGSVSPQRGTITGDWKRVEDQAAATIPDQFVAHLLK